MASRWAAWLNHARSVNPSSGSSPRSSRANQTEASVGILSVSPAMGKLRPAVIGPLPGFLHHERVQGKEGIRLRLTRRRRWRTGGPRSLHSATAAPAWCLLHGILRGILGDLGMMVCLGLMYMRLGLVDRLVRLRLDTGFGLIAELLGLLGGRLRAFLNRGSNLREGHVAKCTARDGQ